MVQMVQGSGFLRISDKNSGFLLYFYHQKVKKLLQPILTAVIIFCFILSSGGSYVVLELIKLNAKHHVWNEITSGHATDEIAKITIPANIVQSETHGFVWEEENKEFKFNNTMCDIISMEQEGADVIFYCLNDKAELKIHQLIALQLSNLFLNKKHDNKSNPNQLLQRLDSNYFGNEIIALQPLQITKLEWTETQVEFPSSTALLIFAPPPESATI